jgi:dTMP kinase
MCSRYLEINILHISHREHIFQLSRLSVFMVLADRYIFTLMARDSVRGISRTWSHNLYGFAIIPDLVYYLDVNPVTLIHRVFEKNSSLDYYESGADMGLSEDMFESFLKYQAMLGKEFYRMQKKYGLVPINGNRSPEEIHSDLKARIDKFLLHSWPNI